LDPPRSHGGRGGLRRNPPRQWQEELVQVCAHLHQREFLFQAEAVVTPEPEDHPDLSDVKGQAQAKRALEIAASGGHNLLLYGPPGTGKTMLASRLPGILPVLNEREMLDVAAV